MNIKKTLTIMAGLLFSMAACEAQNRYKPYEIPPIASTGIPVCDVYFDQLEACIKKQITNADDYKEFQRGIAEAKLHVMFFEDDKERAVYSCNEAKAEAKTKYAGTCTFD